MGQWYSSLKAIFRFSFNLYRLALEVTSQQTLLLWMDVRESVSSNHATIPLVQAVKYSKIKQIFILLKVDGIPLPSESLMDHS